MTTFTEELPLRDAEVLTSTTLDVPALATAFSRRLRDAGMPVTTAQVEQYVLSLELVKPGSRHALYCTTRAVFVTGQQQLTTFDRVFGEVFGGARAAVRQPPAIAGRITSTSPAPTGVWRPSSTRTSSSLR